MSGEWALIRLGEATLSLLVIPVLAALPAIVSLGVAALIVAVVVGAEQFFGGRAKIRTNPEARPAAAEA